MIKGQDRARNGMDKDKKGMGKGLVPNGIKYSICPSPNLSPWEVRYKKRAGKGTRKVRKFYSLFE